MGGDPGGYTFINHFVDQIGRSMTGQDHGTPVWVPDTVQVFVRGTLLDTKIVKDRSNRDKQVGVVRLLESNEIHEYEIVDVSPENPAAFDKVDDMSELTHLNEPSVLYNLENRYREDLIYTYSGLFLVAINPYCNVRIYTQEYINLYHGSPKEDNKPHIFGIAEEAYQRLLSDKQDQSILVTGESGAGKTQNTKRILQYLASITSEDKLVSSGAESFELKILQSNPILESFGNSQTVRNNNSSRFGKFIKIEFDERGKINGAHIEWYLLEKSRVVHQTSLERNYHIFYQLLSGLTSQDLRKLELDSRSIASYNYLNNSNASIPGVDDSLNFQELLSAFKIVGFSQDEIFDIFKVISIILHIGNVEFVSERSEQASIKNDISKLCKLLGVTEDELKTAILKPKSKAGKEWVSQSKNATQARFILNSLSRSLYEKLFAHIVARINQSLDHGSMTANYIGLLDIAGFEIFKNNSFEQLCINYTNEKLQQFFNHYMFVLEQSEYLKENIQWDYIDYGKDLQSTINLIEQRGPSTGVLPLLDEESILPKSTDESFNSKLISTWDQKSTKFKRSKKPFCFILTHYAGDVEYNIDGWLSKNKDVLSDNLLSVLTSSSNQLVQSFFDDSQRKRGGAFRTTSSRHREQLVSLLDQLSSTQPHFARCIIPNNEKKSKTFDRRLILDQLRCNGVLEGIRIAREGYPNRIFFKEFFQRYKLLSDGFGFSSNSKKNTEFLLSSLRLDPSLYKVGSTKLFLKAGVLAELEAKKEKILAKISEKLNANIRGHQIRIDINRQLSKLRAARALGHTFRIFNRLMEDPWYNLYLKIKPLLSSSHDITKTKKIAEQVKALESKLLAAEDERDQFKLEKMQVAKDLEELRSLLATETNKLDQQIRSIEEAKSRHLFLEKQLEEAVSLRKKIEEEKIEAQKQHEKALSEVSQIRQLSTQEEERLKSLQDEKTGLIAKIKELEGIIIVRDQAIADLKRAKDEIAKDIASLKKVEIFKNDEIKSLKSKLLTSEKDLDVKLVTLEKNCTAAMGRLQNLIAENNDLRQQISTSEKEKQAVGRDLKARERDLQRFKDKITSHQDEMSTISTQRDNTVAEHAKVLGELKESRAYASTLKTKIQEMERVHENFRKESEAREAQEKKSNDDSLAIKELERRLAEEISLNRYLNQKVSTHINDHRTLRDMGDNFELSETKKLDLATYYEDLKIKFEELKRKLDEEIEQKKDLSSRLRFTETRLASSCFDSQIAHSQVKKLRKIIQEANLSVNLDAELSKLKPLEVNTEKLVLEVDHLKRQLELEIKSRCDAENVAAALHNKFNQIQRSDSSHDIYRLKYEASEERAKSLETKLRSLPLRDRTNITGDIFTNRESVSKYADEIRFHKLENYKLQEILVDAKKKIASLGHEIKQSATKDILLTEQIERLQKDLDSTERQNELLVANIKQQKQQYENCLNDLHVNETRSREYMHNLKEAENDVKSMAEVIEKLKLQVKQKDKQIWQGDTERNDLDMQLQETILELKKVQEINKMLNEDLRHLKERLSREEDNSQYIEEIEELKSQVNSYMKKESELKKEISTIKYDLQVSSNDSEAKITDLLSQVNHYEKLVGTLGNERDLADAAEKDLGKQLESANAEIKSMRITLDTVSREKSNLEQDLEHLRGEYQNSIRDLEKSLNEKYDISNKVKCLEETLALQNDQNLRNESLVKQLHNDVDTLKKYLKEEKQKSINLYEENQSLNSSNSQLTNKIESLKAQLADSSEKDAWLTRIHELENMVSQESELKYEEMKKLKNVDRIIEELRQKNASQTRELETANEDKRKFDEEILHYNEQISTMERHISQQEMSLKKTVRDNTNMEERMEQLERESQFWKQRYESLASGRSNAKTHDEGVLI